MDPRHISYIEDKLVKGEQLSTDEVRRVVATLRTGSEAIARLNSYSARLSQVAADGALGPAIALDDDTLMPSGSF